MSRLTPEEDRGMSWEDERILRGVRDTGSLPKDQVRAYLTRGLIQQGPNGTWELSTDAKAALAGRLG